MGSRHNADIEKLKAVKARRLQKLPAQEALRRSSWFPAAKASSCVLTLEEFVPRLNFVRRLQMTLRREAQRLASIKGKALYRAKKASPFLNSSVVTY